MAKALKFEVVHFEDDVVDPDGQKVRRRIILLYALGDDGVIYEMSAGKWLALPISKANMRQMVVAPQERKNEDG